MFCPYHLNSQFPEGFNNFDQFYREGNICFSDGSVHLVKNVVDTNRALFEKDADVLNTAKNFVDNVGTLENAWCELCPEQQIDGMECKQLRHETGQESEYESCIPDLASDAPHRWVEPNSVLKQKPDIRFL